jgi:prophage regulatory protein
MNTIESHLNTLPESGLIRMAQLVKVLPISKNTIWRLSKLGKFPKPVKLTENTTAWKCQDVHAWLASKETPVTNEAAQ